LDWIGGIEFKANRKRKQRKETEGKKRRKEEKKKRRKEEKRKE
jgi:hypothetical protein